MIILPDKNNQRNIGKLFIFAKEEALVNEIGSSGVIKSNIRLNPMTKLAKPPGQRLVKRMSTRTKGLIVVSLGLILFSIGLCVFSVAAEANQEGAPFRQWFLWGTYSLILINGGLLLFGQAVRYRVQIDYRRFVRRELKKRDREWARALQKRKAPLGKSEAK